MSLVKKYVYTVILLQLSFAVVNVLGIFPYRSGYSGVSHQQIVSAMSSLQANGGGLSYAYAIGQLFVEGLAVVFSFIRCVFLGFPAMLEAFLIPREIAVPVGYAVDALLLFSIAMMIMGRD
ncbi:MAG: hypothetical protein GXO00_02195 [Candidatus Diapherotrites archaeon]|nr:hypothetical protein [Candidatus Diapherotrites archaeon]